MLVKKGADRMQERLQPQPILGLSTMAWHMLVCSADQAFTLTVLHTAGTINQLCCLCVRHSVSGYCFLCATSSVVIVASFVSTLHLSSLLSTMFTMTMMFTPQSHIHALASCSQNKAPVSARLCVITFHRLSRKTCFIQLIGFARQSRTNFCIFFVSNLLQY